MDMSLEFFPLRDASEADAIQGKGNLSNAFD
jgi:hypothetical protein